MLPARMAETRSTVRSSRDQIPNKAGQRNRKKIEDSDVSGGGGGGAKTEPEKPSRSLRLDCPTLRKTVKKGAQQPRS